MSKTWTASAPNANELRLIRTFDAPRTLLFQLWTEPKHLPYWMTGPEGWTMLVCEIDLCPGGQWRFVWRKPDGIEKELRGVSREIVRPERLVFTCAWVGEDGNPGHEMLVTVLLSEENGGTRMDFRQSAPDRGERSAAIVPAGRYASNRVAESMAPS